jgi:hypothetical protein
LDAINHALDEENSSHTLHELQNPEADLPQVDAQAAALYHAELSGMKEEKQADLDYNGLETAVKGSHPFVFVAWCSWFVH